MQCWLGCTRGIIKALNKTLRWPVLLRTNLQAKSHPWRRVGESSRSILKVPWSKARVRKMSMASNSRSRRWCLSLIRLRLVASFRVKGITLMIIPATYLIISLMTSSKQAFRRKIVLASPYSQVSFTSRMWTSQSTLIQSLEVLTILLTTKLVKNQSYQSEKAS